MKTSAAGRAAIMQREGFRSRAYRDSRGLWTIGVGHYSPPPSFTRWSVWSNTEVEDALAYDLVKFEDAVGRDVRVPLTQNEFDACVSLAFNIGIGGFTGSTVVHFLNEGNKQAAANAFLKWERPPELARRRESERKQFLS